MPRLLVVDDQRSTLQLLAALFEAEGYDVDVAEDAPGAIAELDAHDYDVVFTDLRLGIEQDGIDILQEAKRRRPHAQVVIMTAFSSVESSILAMKAGAYDYITKPFKREELVLLASRAAEKTQLAKRVETLERTVDGEGSAGSQIIGKSKALLQVMRLVGQVARTDATVLITGESGTGKELVAKALHEFSPRVGGPFVAVNCGAIPENLQESEFFGHAKGAFTGASRTKTGMFEQAHGGTLFLDEVGEMTLATQVKLLRFLQSGEVRKVGENKPAIVDARVVAATNRDLMGMIAAKQFREDLYYRLNIVAVEMPALRQRGGDIELLAGFFLARYARTTGHDVRGFTDAAMAALHAHTWPGNVRELENAVERAVTLSQGPMIDVDDLPRLAPAVVPDWSPPAGPPGLSGEWQAAMSGEWEAAWRERSAAAEAYGASFGAPGWPQAGDPHPFGRFPPPSNSPQPATPLSSDAIPALVGGPKEFLTLEQVERAHILLALERFAGSRTKASKALGISKATLWRKIKTFELDP